MSNNKVSERNDLEQPLLSREESVEEPTAEEVLDSLPEQDKKTLISEPLAAEIIRVIDAEVVVADSIANAVASENETSAGQWKSGLLFACRSNEKITFYVLFAITVAVFYMLNASEFNDIFEKTRHDVLDCKFDRLFVFLMLLFFLILITWTCVKSKYRIFGLCVFWVHYLHDTHGKIKIL